MDLRGVVRWSYQLRTMELNITTEEWVIITNALSSYARDCAAESARMSGRGETRVAESLKGSAERAEALLKRVELL
jgi:hypothetical protein